MESLIYVIWKATKSDSQISMNITRKWKNIIGILKFYNVFEILFLLNDYKNIISFFFTQIITEYCIVIKNNINY